MFRLGDDPKLKAVLKELRQSTPDYRLQSLTLAVKVGLLEACRQGTAPQRGARQLAVGRAEILRQFQSDLDKVSEGASRLGIINGAFGMGKSFLLRMLHEQAMDLGFATSFLTLTVRECPLYDLAMVYQHIVRSLRTDNCRERPALEFVLANWAERVREEVVTTRTVPWTVTKLNLEFKTALTAYYDAVQDGQGRKTDVALRWLQADDPDMRSARALGLGTKISGGNALHMLGNLTQMLKYMGFKGLVILMDEADAIPAIPNSTLRMQAYNNLRLLSGATSTTPSSYFVYATTPAFFETRERDIAFEDRPYNEVATVKRLSVDDLQGLAFRIWQLHQDVHGWNDRPGVTRGALRKFAARCLGRPMYVQTTRDFVRAVITALDICQENPGVSLGDVNLART